MMQIWRQTAFLLMVVMVSFTSCNVSHAAVLSITQLRDIVLGEVATSTDRLLYRVRACVNMTPAGPFQLTAFGDGPTGSFSLGNGVDDIYAVRYRVSVGNRPRRGLQTLAPGVPATGLFARQPRPNQRCRPPFTFIVVEIVREDLGRVPSGRYTGRLQLMVAPE